MNTIREPLLKKIETVGEITANRPFLTFPAEGSIENIVREMIRHRQGVARIIAPEASGCLAGLLTERDILRKIFGTYEETEVQHDERQQHLSIYPGTLLAQDVMIINPVCLTEDMPVEAALEKIKSHGFRYMPVVKKSDEKKIIGIVSERELFWHAQEKCNRTIRAQSNLLSFFIQEPYCSASGATVDVSH
jgi:CBS domain-containing protein